MNSSSILHNIRILDFSWVLAGPYATRLLADFGAEVIKVQPPMPEAEDKFSRGYYNTWNRNKLGITLDLNKPQGVALAKRLVGISDAVVENFAPRVMANWGLDYDNLAKIRPDIIMLSMSVMGQTGPWRDYTGFGPTVHALSGMTYLTSFPGKPPTGTGFAYADHAAGLVAAMALLSALEYRRRTGKGQHIDIAQVEAMAGLLGGAILDHTMSGKEVLPAGNSSTRAAPHNAYRCRGKDRWCAIAVFTEAEWQGFKRALGRPSWAEAERFATLSGRLENAEELNRLVSAWTAERTAKQVMSRLQQHGVSAGVVQDAAAVANDPQLKVRGCFFHTVRPGYGKAVADANPVRLSGNPARYVRAAPNRGQDNDCVFRELLGMSEKEIAELRDSQVI